MYDSYTALLKFVESNYKTIKECLDAADNLKMTELFIEGEDLSAVKDAQANVENPDDGEHDQDQGATGDRFNDFMDQIPQMNPSNPDDDNPDGDNYDADDAPPQYEDDTLEGEPDDSAPDEGDTEDLMGGQGFDSMEMPQMMPPMGYPQMGMPMPGMMPPAQMPMQMPMMGYPPMGYPGMGRGVDLDGDGISDVRVGPFGQVRPDVGMYVHGPYVPPPPYYPY